MHGLSGFIPAHSGALEIRWDDATLHGVRAVGLVVANWWKKDQRMRAIGIVGEIDDDHQIRAEAPRDLPPGRVQLIVVRPDEDESGAFWPWDVSRAWSEDLGDARQDIYTLADGKPIDASR